MLEFDFGNVVAEVPADCLSGPQVRIRCNHGTEYIVPQHMVIGGAPVGAFVHRFHDMPKNPGLTFWINHLFLCRKLAPVLTAYEIRFVWIGEREWPLMPIDADPASPRMQLPGFLFVPDEHLADVIDQLDDPDKYLDGQIANMAIPLPDILNFVMNHNIFELMIEEQ